MTDVKDEALKHILEWAKDAGRFANEQAPEVAKEIIAWGIGQSLFWIILMLFLVGVILRVRFHCERLMNLEGEDIMGSWLAALLALFVPIIAIATNVMTLMKCLVAPRLYLIEWISRQIG
jgi:hypothetical protein